jgi:hypothetical protein
MPQSLSKRSVIFDGKKPYLFTINLKQIAFDKSAKLDAFPDREKGKSEPTMPLPMPLCSKLMTTSSFPTQMLTENS